MAGIGLAIFLLIAVVVAVAGHTLGRRFVRVSLLSGAGTAIASQLILQPLSFIVAGQIDPMFTTVGLVVTFVYGTAVALAVGGIMRALGRRPEQRD